MAEIAVPPSGDADAASAKPLWKRIAGKALGDLFKRSTLLLGSRLSRRGDRVHQSQLALARLLGGRVPRHVLSCDQPLAAY